jgi:hypothetical protein
MHVAEPSGFTETDTKTNARIRKRTRTAQAQTARTRTLTRTQTWTISISTNKLVIQSLQHLTNSATESVAPKKWCYQFAAVRGAIYVAISCTVNMVLKSL